MLKRLATYYVISSPYHSIQTVQLSSDVTSTQIKGFVDIQRSAGAPITSDFTHKLWRFKETILMSHTGH